MLEPKQQFDEWLKTLPFVAWGDKHTEIAVRFAEWYSVKRTRRILEKALNSGDGEATC